jgi:hypothetical protein
LKYSKETEDKKTKNPSKWFVKFIPNNRLTEENKLNTGLCHNLFVTLSDLPKSVNIKGLYTISDRNLSVTNEYFISNSSKAQIYLLPIRQGFKKSDEYLSHVIDMIAVQAEILFINNGIFYCQNEFFLTRI